jgi:hypothetical protein
VEGERNLTTARNSRGASKQKANSTRLPPRKQKLLRFRVAKNVKVLEKQKVIEKSEWLKIAEINFISLFRGIFDDGIFCCLCLSGDSRLKN